MHATDLPRESDTQKACPLGTPVAQGTFSEALPPVFPQVALAQGRPSSQEMGDEGGELSPQSLFLAHLPALPLGFSSWLSLRDFPCVQYSREEKLSDSEVVSRG